MHLSRALVRSLPKVALHDHLDGGLRPDTVLELCAELGIDAPSGEAGGGAAAPSAQEVADWFQSAADSGSLPSYLATFDRTLALMQTAPALRRIAREFVEDMVANGVVYAETRWAPHQHTEAGLSLDEAVQAVQDGLDEGVAAASEAGSRIVVGQLLAYLRHLEPTDDLVELAMDRRSTGVVGIDLAGPEAGFPASRFRAQFDLARDHGIHVTIHAGEADGPSSIADAVDCGAQRIGHGVRLLEDIDGIPDTEDVPAIEGTEDAADTDGITAAAGLRDAATPAPSPAEGPASGASTGFGPVAARVHREQICLEVCPSSNLQTGAASDLARHAVGPLHALGFAIAVSSDNRLMSRTSTSREMALAAESCGWTLEDLEQIVLTGLDAGFAPEPHRRALREEVVLPAFRAAREA